MKTEIMNADCSVRTSSVRCYGECMYKMHTRYISGVGTDKWRLLIRTNWTNSTQTALKR